jgi:hypothetical protein
VQAGQILRYWNSRKQVGQGWLVVVARAHPLLARWCGCSLHITWTVGLRGTRQARAPGPARTNCQPGRSPRRRGLALDNGKARLGMLDLALCP